MPKGILTKNQFVNSRNWLSVKMPLLKIASITFNCDDTTRKVASLSKKITI